MCIRDSSKLLRDDRNTLSFGRGTPRYMAPEILTGRGDRRADVFSLGILLFEVMTGELPFEDEGSHLIPMGNEALSPNFPPDFAPELRPVVERCLRRNPEERYASVAELLEGLGQTARRGDSIVLPVAGSVSPKGPAARSASEETSILEGAPAGSPASGDVLEWQTLDREPEVGEPSGLDPVSTGDALQDRRASPRPLRSVQPLTETARHADGPSGAAGAPIPPIPTGESAWRESAVSPAPPRLPAALPVPPRLEGGGMATANALGRTGIEIFVGLVVLPVLAIAHLLGPWVLRLFGLLRRAGKFAWFALLCFGGGALLLLLLVWGAPS